VSARRLWPRRIDSETALPPSVDVGIRSEGRPCVCPCRCRAIQNAQPVWSNCTAPALRFVRMAQLRGVRAAAMEDRTQTRSAPDGLAVNPVQSAFQQVPIGAACAMLRRACVSRAGGYCPLIQHVSSVPIERRQQQSQELLRSSRHVQSHCSFDPSRVESRSLGNTRFGTSTVRPRAPGDPRIG
jgi:hypothetical protein